MTEQPRAPRRAPKRRPPPGSGKRRDIAKPQKRGEIIPFRSNVPRKLSRRNENVIIYYDQLRNVLSWELMLTLLLITFAGLFMAAVHANNTNMTREFTRHQATLLNLEVEVSHLQEQLTERYTTYEIRNSAMELGMMDVDPSQIIHISVPRQSTVMLNIEDHTTLTEPSFWDGIFDFLRATLDRVFGTN